MSLENLLNHTCNIYHNREEQKTPGYGLPASPSFYYPAEPDIEAQQCHFGVRSQSVSVTQTAPSNVMDAKIKLTLPLGTDIRLNDKIVDCDTGLEYTAEQPVKAREHHLFAYIKKIEEQRPL